MENDANTESLRRRFGSPGLNPRQTRSQETARSTAKLNSRAASKPSSTSLMPSSIAPGLGQGICDLRQGYGIKDRCKAVSFLGKSDARPLGGNVLVTVQDHLGGKGLLSFDVVLLGADVAHRRFCMKGGLQVSYPRFSKLFPQGCHFFAARLRKSVGT
jgi:hypothetical protein